MSTPLEERFDELKESHQYNKEDESEYRIGWYNAMASVYPFITSEVQKAREKEESLWRLSLVHLDEQIRQGIILTKEQFDVLNHSND